MAPLRAAVAVAAAALVGALPASAGAGARKACFRPSHASPIGTALYTDVDGDGRADLLDLVYTPRAYASCGFALRVWTAGGAHYARLGRQPLKRDERLTATAIRRIGDPVLTGYARLLPGRSVQPLVRMLHAASDAYFEVFAFRHGRLVRLGVEGGDVPNTFHNGGFVASWGTVDCLRPGSGLVVEDLVFSPYQTGRSWRHLRRLYRFEQRRFRLVQAVDRRISRREVEALGRRLGGGGALFPSCATVIAGAI